MLWVVLASAAEVEINAQARPRFEVRNDTFWVSQRTALSGQLTQGELTVTAEVRDVRTWGEEENTLKDFSADGLDIHVGHLSWRGLTVGRQEFNVHEHRLIGNVGWTQQGRSFDGARYLRPGVLHVETAGAVLAVDSSAWLAYARAGYGETNQVDVLYVVDNGDRHTLGIYALGGTGPLSGRLEAYGQLTDDTTGMVGARGTYAHERFSVTLWGDALAPGFNTLFATNHKFYGLADIAVFQIGGPDDGLINGALKLEAPVGPAKVGLDGHVFLTPAGDYLGSEGDLTVGVPLAPGLKLGAGAAVFAHESGDIEGWGFLQLDAKSG